VTKWVCVTLIVLVNAAMCRGPICAAPPIVAVEVDPTSLSLLGPVAGHTLLVTGTTADGRRLDVAGEAVFRSVTPEVISVDARGLVRPVADGQGSIVIEVAGRSLTVPVVVEGSHSPRQFRFVNDILPLLDKYGCNGAGCHGKAEGQGGFRLSVFASDPQSDYAAMTQAGRGRRILPAAAERSLILLKSAGIVPHGGGVRLRPNDPEFATLKDWISAGAPYGGDDQPRVVRLTITPQTRILSTQSRQQLRVIAHFSDGRTRDVTRLARYQSNNPTLAAVSADGLATTLDRPGQVALRAGFMNQFAIFQALIPRSEAITNWPDLPENNFIDRFVHSKLRALNILPSGLADDAEYLRRVYLDIIGTLPTAEETKTFLDDSSPDRRVQVVERLLKRPEYADFWALKWADLLRVERKKLGHKGAYAYYKWIRDGFLANTPYDQMVRELLTAEGALVDQPQANFYRVDGNAGNIASHVAQTFLGLRIACAQCHHHPTDVWSQSDYWGMQSFFTQVKRKGTPRGEVLWTEGNPQTKHPRTGQAIHPYALGTQMPASAPTGDRRQVLAAWMTSRDNPWFAKNVANRMWAHFMGRGLVEPVDDLRATNPASNPELLEALSQHLIRTDYNLHELIRVITRARAYQLSSTPNDTNRLDEQNYSHANLRPLEAEVLLDAICHVTGVEERFDGVPPGNRAIQLWDSEVSHYFLKLFGRPLRTSACVCERINDPNIAQALHLMNSPAIHGKLKHEGGTLAKLVARNGNDTELIRELYLTFFNRPPFDSERKQAVAYLHNKADRRQAVEDLAWSMLCSIEFIFRH